MTTSAVVPTARHGVAPTRRRHTFLLVCASIALVLVGGAAWSYWLAAVTPGSSGAAAATVVGAGSTPTANASGSTVTVSWSASTLATGQAVTGYEIRRYDATTSAPEVILSDCTGIVATLSCVESSVPSGTWRYSVTPVFATNWRGAESALSVAVTVETTPPVNAISLSGVSGSAILAGTTVYYRGVDAGSVTFSNAVTDADSGPASSQTGALGGTTTGWTHTPSTVSTPAGGPYVSNPFSWIAGSTSSPTVAVTARDVVGNSTTTNLTFVNDSTAPSAGTISYTDGYQVGRSVTVTFTTGTDAGSGITSRQLQRSQAPLTGGTCGSTYSAFVNVGSSSPTSPYTDSQVVNAVCYVYRYVVTDGLGNQHGATTASVAKVDYAGAVSTTTGLVSQWRLGEASAASAMDDVTPTNNNGTYFNTPAVAVAGAIANDANTAVQFDGINDYATTARQIAGDFSVELWVKSTQNFFNDYGYPHCSQWWQGAILVDADLSGSSNDFGLSMCSGKIVAGVGSPDVSVVTSGTYNDNVWHHVVFTRVQTTGALALYVDGALVGSGTGKTTLLNSQPTLSFARSVAGVHLLAGTLDDVSVYNVALSVTTVSNHHLLGASPAADTTGPTGGAVDASGLVGTGSRYSSSPNLSIVFSPGTDPSGLLATGRALTRASATLTTGTCGSYGAYALVTGGTDPTSPKADTVTTASCHRYQYTVSDALGNTTTYTSGDIKVDSTAPSAPALAISSPVNSYWSGSGSTVFYRSAVASGSFVVTGSSTDAQSGVMNYSYPAAGTNWTSTPGALGVTTYSWSGAPAAPGTLNVTATSNAGTASVASPLIFVADDTEPAGDTVSYVNGVYSGTTISVSFATGTDAGSGIGTRLLQRATAALTGTTCGTFGAFATISGGTNPTSPVVDTVATSAACYMYRYVVSDNLGNQHIATNTNVARSPGAIWAFNEGSGVNAADSSGNTRTAILQAGATWTTRSGSPSSGALNLTGATNSYAQFGGPVVDTGESHTVTAWVRMGSPLPTGHRTFAAIDGTTISPFFLKMNGSQRFAFAQRTSDSTGATLIEVLGPTPVANTWYHVAGVYNKQAGTIELFVNGVSQGTAAAGTSWTATGNTAIGRARWGGANVDFMSGALDEVRFYGRALSLAEIQALAAG